MAAAKQARKPSRRNDREQLTLAFTAQPKKSVPSVATPPAPTDDDGASAPEKKAPKESGRRQAVTAETMARAQREISVSEFFAKNRHLLGFDNKRKALLTTVKEAVDNSLDACEEAGILPDLEVVIEQVDEDRFRVRVT